MAERSSSRSSRQRPIVRLTIPSTLGWERVAMDLAASVALRVGFRPQRIDDIRTAVGEATLNAIEHGNKLEPGQEVEIVFTAQPSQLEICVKDRARMPLPVSSDAASAPSLEDRLAGRSPLRGWGVHLIRSLTDTVEFESTDQGNIVRMIVRLPGRVTPPVRDNAARV